MSSQGVFFSVIVPVYNVEPYINECIQSLITQTYNDYEVIFVDDGSSDLSGEICDDYVSKYRNFKVIHQQNTGLSGARNAGLDIAKGEYVIFLDSDDYIDKGALHKFNEVLRSVYPDIIAGYGYRVSGGNEIEEGVQFRSGLSNIVTGREFYSSALYQRKLSVGAPYYIYKRSFINRNNLYFKIGIFHEDELWTPIALYRANTVLDLKYRYYYYRCDNNNSITRNSSKKRMRALDRIKISKELGKFFKDKKDVNSFRDNISAQYMYAVYDGSLARDKKISRFFPIQYAKTWNYVLKALLFMFSPSLACWMRRCLKEK